MTSGTTSAVDPPSQAWTGPLGVNVDTGPHGPRSRGDLSTAERHDQAAINMPLPDRNILLVGACNSWRLPLE